MRIETKVVTHEVLSNESIEPDSYAASVEDNSVSVVDKMGQTEGLAGGDGWKVVSVGWYGSTRRVMTARLFCDGNIWYSSNGRYGYVDLTWMVSNITSTTRTMGLTVYITLSRVVA